MCCQGENNFVFAHKTLKLRPTTTLWSLIVQIIIICLCRGFRFLSDRDSLFFSSRDSSDVQQNISEKSNNINNGYVAN